MTTGSHDVRPTHDHDHDHSHDHDTQEEDLDNTKLVEEESDVEMDGRHTVATEADSAIQKHLAHHVKDAIAKGRKIEGNASIVEGEAWDKAGINHYGKQRWATRKNKINAFVDKNRKVWLHRKRGNAGTMVHEAVHKYSVRVLIRQSQPLNEGVTEYFTRQVCAKLHPSLRRRNYQSNYTTVVALVGYTSEDLLAGAYFDGRIAPLRASFNKHRQTANSVKTGKSGGGNFWQKLFGGNGGKNTSAAVEGGWKEFCAYCSDQDWNTAKSMMK